MATYLIVNLVFIAAIVLLLRVRKISKVIVMTGIALLLLTLIFDSIIVGFDIVGYHADKIVGVYIGRAPIEDFFYAILACILVPTLWNMKGKTNV